MRTRLTDAELKALRLWAARDALARLLAAAAAVITLAIDALTRLRDKLKVLNYARALALVLLSPVHYYANVN